MSKPALQIRWLIRPDMQEVLEIENHSFDFPWLEDEFLAILRQPKCIGMVAELDWKKVVGFMIYELRDESLDLLNFAVHEDYRHQKVGTHMVTRLKNKLSAQRRQRITLTISEMNLPGQLFFQSQDFRAVGVGKGFHEEVGWEDRDIYFMRYSLFQSKLSDAEEKIWAQS